MEEGDAHKELLEEGFLHMHAEKTRLEEAHAETEARAAEFEEGFLHMHAEKETLEQRKLLETACASFGWTWPKSDANFLLVLHPAAGWSLGAGCWDWEGDTGENFDTYAGVQLKTVINMVASLHGGGVDAFVRTNATGTVEW